MPLKSNRSKSLSALEAICKTACDSKAFNIRLYNVQKNCSYTDYIVVMSGTSTRHTQGLAEHIGRLLAKSYVEGEQPGDWIIVDAGDLVVHIFCDDTRQYFHFDKLWADAELVTHIAGHPHDLLLTPPA